MCGPEARLPQCDFHTMTFHLQFIYFPYISILPVHFGIHVYFNPMPHMLCECELFFFINMCWKMLRVQRFKGRENTEQCINSGQCMEEIKDKHTTIHWFIQSVKSVMSHKKHIYMYTVKFCYSCDSHCSCSAHLEHLFSDNFMIHKSMK